eukprot:snap_masked-scaffold_1-processed-gene-1.7-mRNA-1 protein AED:0.20 eAED:0.20 QI:0/-1/0/1/-1/1/1/0/367
MEKEIIEFVKAIQSSKKYKPQKVSNIAFPPSSALSQFHINFNVIESHWIRILHSFTLPPSGQKLYLFNELLSPLNAHFITSSFLNAKLPTSLDFAIYFYLDYVLSDTGTTIKELGSFKSLLRFLKFFQNQTAKKINYISKLNLSVSSTDSFLLLFNNLKVSKPKVEDKTKVNEAKTVEKKVKPVNKAKKAAPTPSKASDGQPEITKLDIRVGKITSIEKHPEKDKLYVEQISFGSEERTIISGLVEYYPDPSVLLGKKIIALLNLKPRPMGAVTSNGLVLCASNAGKSTVEIIEADENVAEGTKVTVKGCDGEPWPFNKVNKKNVLKKVLEKLKTNNKGEVEWDGKLFSFPEGGVCKCRTIMNGNVS